MRSKVAKALSQDCYEWLMLKLSVGVAMIGMICVVFCDVGVVCVVMSVVMMWLRCVRLSVCGCGDDWDVLSFSVVLRGGGRAQ